MDYKSFRQRVKGLWKRAEEPDDFIVVFEGKEHDGSYKLNYEVAYWDYDTEEITFICPTAGYEDYQLCGVYDIEVLVELANEYCKELSYAKRHITLGYNFDIKNTRAWNNDDCL